jgi:hypothetical protein
MFAVVAWMVSALAIAVWPIVIGGSDGAAWSSAFFLWTLAFAVFPVAVATTLLANMRPDWFVRGSPLLVVWSAGVGAISGAGVGLLFRPVDLQLVPVAAVAGTIGGLAGWAVIAGLARSPRAAAEPTDS